MLNFIKNLFKRQPEVPFTGAIMPTEAQLAELPKFNELVASVNTVTWKQLDINKIPKYPVYSQDGSSSCVAMSVSLIATILYYIRTGVMMMFSPAYIYQQRSNRPDSGMIGTNAFSLASKGMLPEVLMPDQNIGEVAMNAVKVQPWFQKVAEVFAFEDTLVQLPLKDIETVASVIQTTGKPVNVWFEFFRSEWTSIPVASQLIGTFLRHSVVAIDYGIWQGERAIAIQESWGEGATQYGAIRIITSSFYQKRNIFAAYPRRFKFDTSASPISFDGTIISAQKCMKKEGFFPLDVPFFENWGNVSRQSAIKFQTAHGLPQTGLFDDATKNKLHQLYP